MSGIVGVLNLDGRPVDRDLLGAMVAAEAHRGPDEEGLWVQGPVGLGHRQLRTTPESLNEHQPVCLEGGRYAITCDGRVDNREELLQALRRKAPVDASTPDAGLILHAYVAWGADCVKHIVGDFAFVIWDERKQELFCARDPMGVRTFFYYHDGSRFVFASDIRAILVDTTIPQHLNELKVGLHLLGHLSEAELTMFQDIFQIRPANCLVVSRSGITRQSYWEPDPWREIQYSTMEEYVEHFLEVFYEAIRCRLRTSTPVGISLSGGLDSTSIACAAAHIVKEKRAPDCELHAFSSVFPEFPTVDESKYIQLVLEATGISGHNIDADHLWGFKPIESSQIHWNQPYQLPFQARQETMLTQARDSGVRVVFTGEGGDELLNPGLGIFVDMMNSLRFMSLWRELRRVTPKSRQAFYAFALKYYKSALWYPVPGVVKRAYQALRPREIPGWINLEYVQGSGVLQHRVAQSTKAQSWRVYTQSQYQCPVKMAHSPFLSYITEMYAYHNIEARHPFLDRRVVEFLIRVPAERKFSLGWTKLLLRHAMDGILPDGVRWRPGKGTFTGVLQEGMRKEEARIRAMLDGGYLVTSGWIDQAVAKDLLERWLAGDLTLSRIFMPLINLEDWLSDYFSSNGGGVSRKNPDSVLIPSGKGGNM